MGVGSWVLKILAKKVVLFPVGKTFHHYWAPLEKFWKNPLVPPPGINPSDTHVYLMSSDRVAKKLEAMQAWASEELFPGLGQSW